MFPSLPYAHKIWSRNLDMGLVDKCLGLSGEGVIVGVWGGAGVGVGGGEWVTVPIMVMKLDPG